MCVCVYGGGGGGGGGAALVIFSGSIVCCQVAKYHNGVDFVVILVSDENLS